MESKKEFIVYGKRAVYEALENNVDIDKEFIEKDNAYINNIKSRIHKKKINNETALANPECLEEYKNIEELKV